MRRRRFRPGSFSDEGEELINLTPLIDVLFVVLIMFILIAPLLDLDHIQLSPKGDESEELVAINNNCPLKIFVQKDDSIWLGKHLLSIDALETTLVQLRKNHLTDTPELYCDEKGTFGTYQRIKNAIEAAGFDRLDVILKRE